MKVIPLTQGKFAKVSDHQYERVVNYCNSWFAHHNGYRWYAKCNINGIITFMHHLILPEKEGFEIDHKDLDGLNNQDDNLRYATRSQNMQNSGTRSNSSTGYKCITKNKKTKRYRVQIFKDYIPIHVGYFSTLEAAIEAYNVAVVELHGEFAVLHSIDDPQPPNVPREQKTDDLVHELVKEFGLRSVNGSLDKAVQEFS